MKIIRSNVETSRICTPRVFYTFDIELFISNKEIKF